MAIKQVGDWKRMRAAMKRIDSRALQLAEKVALYQEAHKFRADVIKCFNTSGKSNGIAWEKNKPSVLASKRSSKPLINTADLRNSVQVIGRNQFACMVGIPNNKKTRDGKRMVRIAEVHEFGKLIVIPITQRMFNYVMAMLAEQGGGGSRGSGTGEFKPGGILIIQIPQRSFIQSTADAHFDPLIARERFIRRVGLQLGGTWAALAAGGGVSAVR